MKKITRLYLLNIFILGMSHQIYSQPRSSLGGYNIYYGNLHNHTTLSDSTKGGPPSLAYNVAKAQGLDFYGISDYVGPLVPYGNAKYKELIGVADSLNVDNVFTTFYGYELTSYIYGHVTVFNTNSIRAHYQDEIKEFDLLSNWLSIHECIAFLCHPGYDPRINEFSHFNTPPSDNIVGIELWNTPDGFEKFYYNDGYYPNDDSLGYWEEGLARGWKLGAAGGEDRRDDQWGSDNYSMAILADSLTRESLYGAMKARRFYSTSDKNIALSFKIDDQEMGSTVSGGSNVVQVQAFCNNGDIVEKIMLFKNGIEFHTWSGTISEIETKEVTSTDGDYYYVKVTQDDGDEAISSPIWIEGGPKRVSVSIASSMDDVEESISGSIYHNSSDIELTYDNANNEGKQIIGLRFSDLNIPQGATINSASIQFTCDEASSDETNLTIYGHDSDNSPIFTQISKDVSDRPKTNASVNWRPDMWISEGNQEIAQRSSDVSVIIQEIVNRNGFTPNSAISFIIEGVGNRIAYSYDGDPNLAPLLTVIYTSTN